MKVLNKSISVFFGLITFFFASGQEEKIKWLSWEEVVIKRQQEPKKVIVDVYTDWCGWCKKMDASTFSNQNLVKYVNENYYAIKFDAEQKEPIILGTDTFKFIENGRRGYHELAALIMNSRMSYPTTVFLDENINMIQPIPGYLSVQNIEPILIFIAEEKYKSQEWTSFQQNYKPTF